MGDHNPSENANSQPGLGEGGSSGSSSCMVVLKLPSVAQNDEPASSRTPASRVRRRKTVKKEAYDNDMTTKSSKRKRERFDSEEHKLALKIAKELQANLSSEHPSFVKQLQRSHVKTKFVLGIPKDFCSLHLPEHNNDVILDDESGESYTIKFHAGIEGIFMGGWKKFSLAHDLLEGDVLVFHLLKPCYFKVYIVRAKHPNAAHNVNLASSNEGNKRRRHEAADRIEELALVEAVQEIPLLSSSDLAPASSHSIGNDHDLQISNLACQLSGSDADFEKFKITVKGETIDSELPRATRLQYYRLCCSRGSYLHEKVDRTLAASFIKATLKAADTIRGFEITTAKEDFAMWGDTLEAFQMLGMDVGFLSERLKRLARLGSELGEGEEVMKFIEAEKKRERMVEEIRGIEGKLLGLKEAAEKVEADMKTIKGDVLKDKDRFQQEANAPW